MQTTLLSSPLSRRFYRYIAQAQHNYMMAKEPIRRGFHFMCQSVVAHVLSSRQCRSILIHIVVRIRSCKVHFAKNRANRWQIFIHIFFWLLHQPSSQSRTMFNVHQLYIYIDCGNQKALVVLHKYVLYMQQWTCS